MENPNSFDQSTQDVPVTNPDTTGEGTESSVVDIKEQIDYETKFKESAKEAQRLYAENQRLKELTEVSNHTDETNLYPGFDTLDEEAQNNLVAYSEAIKSQILKDPAIVGARLAYQEKKWNDGFSEVLAKYPELNNSRDEFKQKYFDANNVPENITDILNDVAKIHLFDKAKELGALEERRKAEMIDLERVGGGEKAPVSNRTLEEWQRMAQENPAKFAQLSKDYHADLESGKLRE